MLRWLGKLLFPHQQRAARKRKMQILCVTVFGGLAASALIALAYILINSSERF